MAGWREIDWRGNGLIVLTLTAGMQIALPKKKSLLRGEPHVEQPGSRLMWRRKEKKKKEHSSSCHPFVLSYWIFDLFRATCLFLSNKEKWHRQCHSSARGQTDRQVKGHDSCREGGR